MRCHIFLQTHIFFLILYFFNDIFVFAKVIYDCVFTPTCIPQILLMEASSLISFSPYFQPFFPNPMAHILKRTWLNQEMNKLSSFNMMMPKFIFPYTPYTQSLNNSTGKYTFEKKIEEPTSTLLTSNNTSLKSHIARHKITNLSKK